MEGLLQLAPTHTWVCVSRVPKSVRIAPSLGLSDLANRWGIWEQFLMTAYLTFKRRLGYIIGTEFQFLDLKNTLTWHLYVLRNSRESVRVRLEGQRWKDQNFHFLPSFSSLPLSLVLSFSLSTSLRKKNEIFWRNKGAKKTKDKQN